MRLENSFEVPAPPEAAWSLLNDVPRIVPCMPGTELTETVDENAWKATMHVKLGPIALQFLVDLSREEADEAARRILLRANAREQKGRGGARATIESSLQAQNGGTRVSIVTDLTLQGPVAQYGRGIVGEVAEQLTRQFADCIARQLEASPASLSEEPAGVKPVGGLRLMWRALLRRLRFRKP
jgi:hypothetical protein